MAQSTKSEVPPSSLVGHEPERVGEPLSIIQLQELLIKHYGLHEGLYDVMFEMQFTAGAVGPDPENTIPGAIVGFSKIGLAKAGPNSKRASDAAIVNPAPKGRKRPT